MRNIFIFYGEGLLAPHQTLKLEDHPLSSVRGCLFNIFAATHHSSRPFLHLQPEDTPCCDDRNPPNMTWVPSSSSYIAIDSQSAVCLGVFPLLEQVTKYYISLRDNYILYFSCRAPTLIRGRVCKLQCNDASSISSYIATDSLSASSSSCQAPNGVHDQISISLFDNYFLSSRCRTLSPLSPMNRVIQPKVKVMLV
jgi:hypothetical protein